MWLASAQFGLVALGYLRTWLTLHLVDTHTDFYLVTIKASRFLLAYFLPALAGGLIIGLLFSAADVSCRPELSAKEATVSLTRNLLKSGVVVSILIVLCQAIFLILINQFFHSRYHAYPPDMIWMNRLRLIEPLLVIVGLLWALQRTLRTQPLGEK